MAEARLKRVLALCRAEVPGLRLVDRHESRLMRGLAWLVRPVNPDFLAGYTTVIGATVYLPGPPERVHPERLAATLLHELVHQGDQARWGLLFYLSYGLLPLPAWRTARAYWERRAYAVDLLLAYERGGDAELERVATWLVGVFAGPSYGFMWGGEAAARAYLAPVLDEVRSGALAGRAPYQAILAAWRGLGLADSPTA